MYMRHTSKAAASTEQMQRELRSNVSHIPVIFVFEAMQEFGGQHNWFCNTIAWLQHSNYPVPTQGNVRCKGQAKLLQRQAQPLAER